MLSRRHLRIKVMQVLYTHELEQGDNLQELLNLLTKLMTKSEELYYLILLYLIDITQFVNKYSDKRAAKMLATNEDLNVDVSLAKNPIILHLLNSKEFQLHVKRMKIVPLVNQDEVKLLFEDLVQKEKYQEYAHTPLKTIEQEKSILIYILKKIVDDSEDLFHQLDDNFINLSDDFHTVNFLLQKAVESFDPKHGNNFIFSIESDLEDIQFARELLELTFLHDKEIRKLIAPKLRNWDMDRIAIMDMILLKMAVCELKHFPLIPTKVTINEYIEISKQYSTPKSKDFLNGILDKLMHEMKQSGDIVKKGRGLLEH